MSYTMSSGLYDPTSPIASKTITTSEPTRFGIVETGKTATNPVESFAIAIKYGLSKQHPDVHLDNEMFIALCRHPELADQKFNRLVEMLGKMDIGVTVVEAGAAKVIRKGTKVLYVLKTKDLYYPLEPNVSGSVEVNAAKAETFPLYSTGVYTPQTRLLSSNGAVVEGLSSRVTDLSSRVDALKVELLHSCANAIQQAKDEVKKDSPVDHSAKIVELSNKIKEHDQYMGLITQLENKIATLSAEVKALSDKQFIGSNECMDILRDNFIALLRTNSGIVMDIVTSHTDVTNVTGDTDASQLVSVDLLSFEPDSAKIKAEVKITEQKTPEPEKPERINY